MGFELPAADIRVQHLGFKVSCAGGVGGRREPAVLLEGLWAL